MKNIYIITGTTKGLGKALFEILDKKNNIIITINRKNIIYKGSENINLNIDLSKVELDKIKNFELELLKLINTNITSIVFINNAFTLGTLSKIDALDDNELINVINTNVISSTILIKHFLEITKSLKITKKVLNISSGAAKNAIDGWSMYCMTKSALEMFIKSINIEYPDYEPINIDPGVMNTVMQATIRDFKSGKDHNYFDKLYRNNQLKNTDEVAQSIIEEYLL